MSLKVLMMGGRRCGKTSALASLFDQMINGATNQFLTVSDKTDNSQNKDGESIDALHDKKYELLNLFQNLSNNKFVVDSGLTKHFWDYKLKVQIPGTSRSMYIDFRDIPGEYCEPTSTQFTQIEDYVRTCDVYVIVIDTPYLMSNNIAVREAACLSDGIHRLLTNVDLNSNELKQVIFVPIKCEYWMKNDKINEVNDKIRKVYSASIKHLQASKKTEMSIIPIQTAGDIIFTELTQSYNVVNTDTGKIVHNKCAKISNKIVRLQDGNNYPLQPNETLVEDLKSIFEGTPITRPIAWYELSRAQGDPQYKPCNCEQLPLHIIRFMFNKDAIKARAGVVGWFMQIFGQISKQTLQNALINLQQNNLIKDNMEGIERIM